MTWTRSHCHRLLLNYQSTFAASTLIISFFEMLGKKKTQREKKIVKENRESFRIFWNTSLFSNKIIIRPWTYHGAMVVKALLGA
jgi:hypothetical protein